jgi:hypothetical protein
MACSSGPDIIQDGLVLCLDAASIRSYPKSGTTWSDLKSGGDGTLTNSPSFSSENSGSIVFDGANDYFSYPDSDAFNTGNYFSCCLWVYPHSFQNNHTMLFNKGDSNGVYKFRLKLRALSGGTGEVIQTGDGDYDIRFGVCSTNTSTGQLSDGRFIIAFGNLSDYLNKWNYMCGINDGATMKLYWNGEEKVSYTHSQTIINSTDPVRISYPQNIWGNGTPFDGQVSCASFYNRALSADEVRQNYLSTKERFA